MEFIIQSYNLKEKMWNDLLNEAKSQRKFQNTPIIILGRKHSGKRSLIQSLFDISKTTPQQKKFSIDSNKIRIKGLSPVIDYAYLNVLDLNDPDYRTHSKLEIYMIEDTRNPQIYAELQKPEILKKAVIIIMLDFTSPWTFMEELDGWIRFLYELQKKAGLTITQLESLSKKVQHHYISYKEPEFDENGKLKKDFEFEQSGQEVHLEVPEGVLTNNIRMPFIVCVNKCDLQSSVLRDESTCKISFVLYHLRRFCLQYGGTLIYTSIKNNSNLGILYEYILNRSYDMPLKYKPELANEQAIFVPLGFDNPSLLQDTIFKVDLNKSYSDVITPPLSKKFPKQQIIAEEDSQFFKKYIGTGGSVRAQTLTTQQSTLTEQGTRPTEATDFFRRLLESSGNGRNVQNAQNDLLRHANRQVNLNRSATGRQQVV